jgi:flagellar hook-basal body complex protein FliE
LHGVMVTMQKAELNLQLAIQVRNKVVEAYNEIMRIQV